MSTTPFKKIVVPIDFSELSAQGLRYAGAIAACSGASLAAVYANSFSPPPYFTEHRVADFERQFRESFADAERAASNFVASALGQKAQGVASYVIEGLPADVIRDFAAKFSADLIVMGAHGRSGVNRWLLGSVAERVLRESALPVLTVRMGERADAGIAPIRKILCPVNDSETARKALRTAMALGACFGAKVIALHVQEGGSDSAPDLCSWLSDAERRSCEIEEIRRRGEAAAEIVSASAETGCDLAVIGARHRTFFDSTVLGITAVRVLRHSHCPVLTVIDADDRTPPVRR